MSTSGTNRELIINRADTANREVNGVEMTPQAPQTPRLARLRARLEAIRR